MISALRLYNFKCFEDQRIDLKALTLLSGLNGTGKSTVLQALLLLRQSYQQRLLPGVGLALNGDLARIGTASDALFMEARENYIGFDIALDDGKEGRWRFNYNLEADVLALDPPPPDLHIYDTMSLFGANFHYLQAERIGPRSSYETSDYVVRQQKQLGPGGEYTAHFLSLFGDGPIPDDTALNHPRAASLTLRDQVEAWLGEVSLGARIHPIARPEMDLVGLQYSFNMGTQFSNRYRATNVGFGITYILPVIVAALASPVGTLLLIENPEAHLHPKGQVCRGDLLARAAHAGVQVVVETHSDHVLNGIRLAVRDGRLQPDHVQMHFFRRPERGGQANEVVSPRVDRNGRISSWPNDFFDQWDKSLEALL